jgi:hypothetical protein
MSSESKLLTRNQRIVSGVFMFFILVFTIVLTYYSFNLSSSLKNLTDKSNPSITSYTNAFNSWDIALIALGVLILIITIIGVILSPYIIIAFLFLFLLVLIALFVYTAIALNALLGTSDYTSYTSNFVQGLNAAIILMVISAVLILAIVIFCYFMLRSLSKAGGLESELEYVISKFESEEKEKQQIFNQSSLVEQNKRLVAQEAEQAQAEQEVEEQTQPKLTKREMKQIQDIEDSGKAQLEYLKQNPEQAQTIYQEISDKYPDRAAQTQLIKDYQNFKNIKTEETANAKKDYELLIAAQKIKQQQEAQQEKQKGKGKVSKQGQLQDINQLLSPTQIKILQDPKATNEEKQKIENEVIDRLPPTTPLKVVRDLQKKIKNAGKRITFEDYD